ncbi:homoserine O-acetyltransferase [Deinococcus sp. HSC-46F16]|uniref:alpha/beta fold hydrolase n=1 Tax=Deinococcus sp. HSC-46F16 TaxID=2910968 RepID=UPI00209DB8AE|nr:alpha/beta fold hydrolase [Deinococcus sp. HSC-46F16]MCP2013903.1 homoserine O-acetyltransferase [Deinococcus sp. HSC-46F16]
MRQGEDREGAAFTLEVDAALGGVKVPVRLGGRTWGQPTEARDNAVLVCHYYTGTAQAAGETEDGTPGWWAPLIGPGRAVDTDRYFVVALNTPSNVQVHDPAVVTTGPDTPHPDGQPWGGRFPAWDFADLHALQLELLRQLGLERWHAVIGPSFGGMQALQWAARTPDLAPRVAAVATSPCAGPVLRHAFGPLLRDVAPAGGLAGALRLISFFGMGADGLEAAFRDTDFGDYLRSRSGTASLAHILDIARVVQTHDLHAVAPRPELFTRWRDAGVRLLTVNIRGDQFFPAHEMRAFADASRAAGVAHTHFDYDSDWGHLGCVQDTAALAGLLRGLLDDTLPAAVPPPDLAGAGEVPHA